MYTKLEITGTLEVVTGMHIGGSSAFSAIGAVDSPIVRDTLSDLPMIPGSSLKGKLRTLLARQYNKNLLTPASEDHEKIKRLFGSAGKDDVHFSRLVFSDMVLCNMDEIKEYGLNSATEVKFENTINRLTAVANPRQVERTIRGAKFPLSVIYNMEEESQAEEDIKTFAQAMKLLSYDYLGGHGSRGYGRIKFKDLQVKAAVGNPGTEFLEKCREIIEEV